MAGLEAEAVVGRLEIGGNSLVFEVEYVRVETFEPGVCPWEWSVAMSRPRLPRNVSPSAQCRRLAAGAYVSYTHASLFLERRQ